MQILRSMDEEIGSTHLSMSTLLVARAFAAAAAFSCARRCASARAADMRADTSALHAGSTLKVSVCLASPQPHLLH